MKFAFRGQDKISCETCINMNDKKNKITICKECKIGFVELDENNWVCIGLIEKYGMQVFLDGMGGINTNSIKNVLESEGYKQDEYSDLFHSLVIFITTALSESRTNRG